MRYEIILSAVLLLGACYSPTEWEGHEVTVTINPAGVEGLTIERAKVLLSRVGEYREIETTTNDQGVAHFSFIPAGTWTVSVALMHFEGPSCDFGSREITVPSDPITMGCSSAP